MNRVRALSFTIDLAFYLLRNEEMAQIDMTDDGLKQVLKEVLVEVMEERREYVRDLIEEVLEEFEMIEDHREVRTADPTWRRPVFAMHTGEA